MNHPHSSPSLRETVQLAGALNTFGFRVYHQLPKDGNCFFSPISIGGVLGALALGARGDTRRELEAVLGFGELTEGIQDRYTTLLETLLREQEGKEHWVSPSGRVDQGTTDRFDLQMATGFFAQSGFPLQTEYVRTLEQAFRIDLLALDFGRPEEAASRINQWVSDCTDERINQIVFREHLDPLTRLILANAVYFLASWRHQFEEELTRLERFHRKDRLGDSPIEVQMMHAVVELPHHDDRRRGFEAVIIPYQSMSMMVILPDAGRLADADEALTAALVEDVAARAVNRSIALGLPRFELEASYELRDALNVVGVRRAFDLDRADLGGIGDATRLAVSQMLHRARIRVDEYGTEAVAAAVAVISRSAAPFTRVPHPFIVNRPFILLIRDDVTHTILFMGRVTNPGE